MNEPEPWESAVKKQEIRITNLLETNAKGNFIYDYKIFKLTPTDTPSCGTKTAETSWWQYVFVGVWCTRIVCITP